LVAASFAACNHSTSPQSGPAVMPNTGAEFTYQVQDSNATLQEQTTITDLSGTTFIATRRSDTVGGFATTSIDTFLLLSDGDLDQLIGCCCDTAPLTIGTHRSFDGTPPDGGGIPTKLNGFVDSSSSVRWHTQYEGEETVTAAGTSFACSKVSKTLTVTAISPNATSNGQADTESVIHRYWYSPQLGFFVKDQELSQIGNSTTTVNFTRTLVSYKLGK